MTVAIRRGLYYSYIITSQSYSAVRLISSGNGFNKLDAVAELVELVDAIIGAECYIGGNASFYMTNYHQWLFYSGPYTKYKILISAVIIKRSISSSFIL